MAPKKKAGKKQADDWEADLGETPDPVAAATQEAKGAEADQDGELNGDANGEQTGGGGLLAALKKNKAKRAKKGKPFEETVEGEESTNTEDAVSQVNLDEKAPEEGNLEDEDVFAAPVKKGKGSKKHPDKPAEEEDEDEQDDGGGLKSKKEKEREKKEREKQRKRENV